MLIIFSELQITNLDNTLLLYVCVCTCAAGSSPILQIPTNSRLLSWITRRLRFQSRLFVLKINVADVSGTTVVPEKNLQHWEGNGFSTVPVRLKMQ